MLRRCDELEVLWEGEAGEKSLSSIEGYQSYKCSPSRSSIIIKLRCTIQLCTASGRLACLARIHKLTKLTREIWDRLIRGAGMSLKEEAESQRPYFASVSGVLKDLCKRDGLTRPQWRKSVT
jgi:hypothetical protein